MLTHRLNRFVVLLFKFKNLMLVIFQVAMALDCFSNTLGFHLTVQLSPFVVFLQPLNPALFMLLVIQENSDDV